MRDVPDVMTARWHSGEYMGESRPICRITVQKARMTVLGPDPKKTYATMIFNNPNTPVEFTAVKSLGWDRNVDQDVASANLELWNTADLGVGEQPFNIEELDFPGIYSYQLDGAKYGRLPNDLAKLLVPDNIVRTYEGYGFDPEQIPEKDPNLVITGTWMIDDVVYNIEDGTIQLAMRDLGRLLIEQVAFKPVVPNAHYPPRFSRSGSVPSFQPPFTRQGIDDLTGYSSESYNGPLTPPTITNPIDAFDQVAAPSGQVTITFDPPPYVEADEELPPGYANGTLYRAPKGYFVRYPAYGGSPSHGVEWYACTGPGQVNAAAYLYGPATTVTDGFIPEPDGTFVELMGGPGGVESYIPEYAPIGYAVYVSSRLQPILLEEDDHEFTLTGLMNGNIYSVAVATVWQHFESSAKQTGQPSVPVVVRPSGGGAVSVDALSPNVAPLFGQGLWRVSWDHTAGATPVDWTIIQYQGTGESGDYRKVYTGTTSTPDTAFIDIPEVPGKDDNEYSYLIYGAIAGQVGRGNLLLAVQGEAEYYRPPQEAAPPPYDDYVVGGGIQAGNPDQVIPRNVVAADIDVRGSSRLDQAVSAADSLREFTNMEYAIDGDMGTHWTSENKGSPNDRVYIEFNVPNVTISRIRVFTHDKPYQMWVHVYADGRWRSYSDTNRIDGLPYLQAIGSVVEGPTDFIPQLPIADVTRVRLTMSNLKAGTTGYHGKVRLVEVGVPLVEINEGQDPEHEAREARAIGGAGDRPHTYNDYCADTETEILTRRGWLRYDEVHEGDEALAIDPATGVAGWQVIESVYRQRRQREMVSMESQTHSSLTTPDHRWLVTDQKGNRFWRTTETLKTGHRIPLAALGAAAMEAKHEDWFVELVAWFWTEGWWRPAGGPALAQSEVANPDHVERIRACLTKGFGPSGKLRRGRGAAWSEARRADGVITFSLTKRANDLLRQAVDQDKALLPEFLTTLTQAQLDLLIERSIDADGWRTTYGRVGITQAHEGRARAFEMALALAGRPFRTRERDGVWGTHLLRHRVTLPQSAMIERVQYDDVIWCPTLRHHNWLARRNGTAYFTGNTDIVKLFCAWGGFFWPQDGTVKASDGSVENFNFGEAPYNLGPYVDLVLGTDTGRVWGDFERSGTGGVARLPVQQFDKKTLMDCINYVRNILGFIFQIDEEGGVIWRQVNVFRVGNFVLNRSDSPGFTIDRVVIDERVNLMRLTTTISSKNVRDKIYVATTDGRKGAVVNGFVENEIGHRRVAGWTDQHFKSDLECEVMAQMIAIRQLFTYRTTEMTIPAYPRIQINDQIQVRERITQEDFLHYVSGVSSKNDLTTGEWTYDLTTHWLGTDPDEGEWALNFEDLVPAAQQTIQAQDTGSLVRYPGRDREGRRV